jgi:hypothetical protein
MKFSVLALALVASVSAQDSQIFNLLQEDFGANENLPSIIEGVDAIEAKAERIQYGVEKAAEGFKNVDGIVTTIAGVAGRLDGIDAKLTGKLSLTTQQLEYDLSNAEDEINAKLSNAISQITATLSTQLAEVDGGIKSDLTSAEKDNAAIIAETAELVTRVNLHKACQAEGQIYNAKRKACDGVKLPNAKTMPRVAHRMFNNEDGRDSGYVDNRAVSFKKVLDETYVRIFYMDNFRVHGHSTHARWSVMICDSNGNGCAQCNDPGQIMNWRVSSHWHNWWMNDHWGEGVSGLCKKSDNRDMRKGDYQLRVYIHDNYYDIYTGANQHSSFMVDEVYKY